jgi:glycosyltransferase involved in cell wall biosynthesis
MKIAIVTETLHAGGAETFVVRLANALAMNHEVILINIYPRLSRKGLMDQVSKDIRLINLNISFFTILSKFDGILYRAKIDYSCIDFLVGRKLKKHIVAFQPNVVHSHLFKTDHFIAKLKEHVNIKFNHVTTVHGDYLLFEKAEPVRVLNYRAKLIETLRSLNNMVTISAEQMQWALKKKNDSNYGYALFDILNGYELPPSTFDRKSELGLNDSHFVYGMVGRGVKEKGWQNLINAFNTLNIKNKRLLLVGAGPELDRLKAIYRDDRDKIFAGYATVSIEFIRLFDVAIFTSYSPGESLPTVIIEYLLCNKPTIATDIGAVKRMLQTSSDELAGLLIEHDAEQVPEDQLIERMLMLYMDSSLREKLKGLSAAAALKFDMQRCIDSYLKIYNASTR